LRAFLLPLQGSLQGRFSCRITAYFDAKRREKERTTCGNVRGRSGKAEPIKKEALKPGKRVKQGKNDDGSTGGLPRYPAPAGNPAVHYTNFRGNIFPKGVIAAQFAQEFLLFPLAFFVIIV